MKEFLIAWFLCFISFVIGDFTGRDHKQELTYSQRRDIAITFMCTEHNNWKGAKNFCGSLPLDSDMDKK